MVNVGWKQVVAALTLVVFVATVLAPVVPRANAAEPCAMMMDQTSTDHDQTKAKGTLPCDGMSCVILCALPTPFATDSTTLSWSSVDYATAADILTGLSVPPDRSPPRPRA